MSNLRAVQIFNSLILLFGIGMCIVTFLLFTNGISFLILLLTGASGVIALVLGSYLLVDLKRFRDQMRIHDAEI